MGPFYANLRAKGAVRYGQFPFSIGVHDSREPTRPVGMAFNVGPTDDGLEAWQLLIDGAIVPGRFVIVDGEFRPAP